MKFELAFPREAQRAKAEGWPLIIPIGTVEYHGPHCAFGCDTLIVQGLLERMDKERNIVIFPPVWYGVASYAVAGPEKNTVHVNADVFEANITEILRSLLDGGWKNIYMVIQHQYEQENLLPMTLACMKAAQKLIFEYLEDSQGRGWWGNKRHQEDYDPLAPADNPWNWITMLPAISKKAQDETGYDHAGKYEASILKVLYPEAVRLERIAEGDEWFAQSARDANAELGEKMIACSLRDLNEKIK